MKIRYYLRGLGIGILVTAIFFMVSNRNLSPAMNDEQIKARAKELGMIESTVLAEIPTETAPETTVEDVTESIVEIVEPEEESVAESTAESVSEPEAETEIEQETEQEIEAETESVAETESETDIEETPEANGNTAPNTEPVSIMVNRGEGSDTVSRRLQEAGLVADAYEYDRYLMANGYDKRIGAGEHVIPAGATWEEIAKILCN